MDKQKDIIDKAVYHLKSESIPPGPPQQTIDATLTQLAQESSNQETVRIERRILFIERLKAIKPLTKFAVAALLLIAVGCLIGRLSAPKPPDIQQLKAALEPAIRQDLLKEMAQYWQVSLTAGYAQLKDELQQQYRKDLTGFAIQTLAATNAVTNQRLEELIDAINTAQIEDRRWVAAAFNQSESNRLQDKAQFAYALETLANQTGDELMRTKQEMAQFLTYSRPDSLDVNKSDNLNSLDEKSR